MKSIKKMPLDIFSKENSFYTNYPHNMKQEEYENVEEYYAALKEKIDNLAISDRLNDFELYFDIEPFEQIVIFPIEGLITYEGYKLGDVNFYSPRVEKYIKNPSDSDYELFNRKEEDIFNAIVKVKAIDYISGKRMAIDKIEKSFDLLKTYYGSKTNLIINSSKYITLNKEYKIASSGSSSKNDEYFKLKNSLEIDNYENNEIDLIFQNLEKYIFQSLEMHSQTQSKIISSLHWFRKGEETVKAEDKLLNYWIVVENLLDFKVGNEDSKSLILNKDIENTFNLAKELIPSIEIKELKMSIFLELFMYLRNLMGRASISTSTGEIRKALEIPMELQNICNLNSTGSFNLEPFVKNLEELKKYSNRKIISDKIETALNFYQDNSFAHTFFEEKIKLIQDELLNIYRYRNKIVHNAHYDDTLLPHYVKKIQNYANNLLRYVLYEQSINNTITLKEIFFKVHYETKLLLKKLNDEENIDIFSYKM
ncbi:hypothetical protein [Psychrobacillus sp. FSL H8-0487]|uniref:hypothetical protein n=1 Tax=Psychrobacillus sp. FSL H8-0487 TaxID=2921391 RepID=UPI0030FB75C3